MSHLSRLKTKLVSEPHLIRALGARGFQVAAGPTEVRSFEGRRDVVDLKVATPGGPEIGFRRTADGFQMVADFWHVRMRNQNFRPEEFERELTRQYAYEAAVDSFAQKGLRLVEQTAGSDGGVRLVFRSK